MEKAKHYKPSAYNHFFDFDDTRILAFNAKTASSAFFFTDALEKIRFYLHDGNTHKDPIFESLVSGGFLIDLQHDEKEDIRSRTKQSRLATTSLGLTIAPTMGCNFDCPYCFESKEARSEYRAMSEVVQDQLLALVQNHIQLNQIQSLSVTWFGGEPLLAQHVIDRLGHRLKDLCIQANIPWSNMIITNGYKLTPKAISLLESLGVNTIQITLDGPQHIHDTRRTLKGDAPTYDVILNNIVNASKTIPVSIRTNVDKTNVSELQNLVNDLLKRPITKHNLDFNIGHIHSAGIPLEEMQAQLNSKEFAEVDLRHRNALKEHNMGKITYPNVVGSFCSADQTNGLMVGPTGELYQCWEDFGDPTKVVGSLFQSEQKNQAYTDLYMNFDATTHPKCGECNVMPLCMGGCPVKRLQHQEPQCGVYKFNLEERLKAWLIQENVT